MIEQIYDPDLKKTIAREILEALREYVDATRPAIPKKEPGATNAPDEILVADDDRRDDFTA